MCFDYEVTVGRVGAIGATVGHLYRVGQWSSTLYVCPVCFRCFPVSTPTHQIQMTGFDQVLQKPGTVNDRSFESGVSEQGNI